MDLSREVFEFGLQELWQRGRVQYGAQQIADAGFEQDTRHEDDEFPLRRGNHHALGLVAPGRGQQRVFQRETVILHEGLT